MKIRPLHDRVIVKRLDNERKTASGIVIPDNVAEKPDQGEIVAVGPGKRDDNGKVIGDCDSGPEMHFSFHELLAHVAKTRTFTAGTVLGSGTVSNADRARGVSCLAERRMIEIIEGGKATTPFMKVGDTIEIEAFLPDGTSPFGTISQKVVEP